MIGHHKSILTDTFIAHHLNILNERSRLISQHHFFQSIPGDLPWKKNRWFPNMDLHGSPRISVGSIFQDMSVSKAGGSIWPARVDGRRAAKRWMGFFFRRRCGCVCGDLRCSSVVVSDKREPPKLWLVYYFEWLIRDDLVLPPFWETLMWLLRSFVNGRLDERRSTIPSLVLFVWSFVFLSTGD